MENCFSLKTPQFHFWLYIWKNTNSKRYRHPVFIVALFMVFKTKKLSKCPSVDKWINKLLDYRWEKLSSQGRGSGAELSGPFKGNATNYGASRGGVRKATYPWKGRWRLQERGWWWLSWKVGGGCGFFLFSFMGAKKGSNEKKFQRGSCFSEMQRRII